MSQYDFDMPTMSATSLLELEIGDTHTPEFDEYWMAPLKRTVILPGRIAELSPRPASVASRDSHFTTR